jgi:hypothetical protein
MLRHRLEHTCCSTFLSIMSLCLSSYLVVCATFYGTWYYLNNLFTNLQCLVVCICCICTLEYLMQILWNCVPIIVSIANSYYIIISKPVTKWMVYL